MTEPKRVCLGDLVVAAFEAAGRLSDDEHATSWLAACAVRGMLLQAGRADLARKLAVESGAAACA